MRPIANSPGVSLLLLFSVALLCCNSGAHASVLAEFPLSCRVVEPANYSATKAERELELVIERANSRSIFSYPKDPSDKRLGGIIFPQLGYFVELEDGKDLLQATDSMTKLDRLQLSREPNGQFRFQLNVGSNSAGGSIQGACRKTPLAVSKFPFRDSLWPAKDYAEVRVYHYNTSSKTGAPIYHDGRFSDTIVKSVKLNGEQVNRLIAATTGRHPDHPVARCYVPRHAFVFLDVAGRPISYAEVCFECSNYRLSNSERARFDLNALAQLVQGAGMPRR